ncbi:unnamed protein product [Schistosoma mattheei]|uniref:Uncharacterized protein n=1 Tax=Schistosoma mattheei TaxID=31246 RepID=A0AA85B7D2_9TREM|nr:unnamed protein product [Schistosoma mattheei]
MSERNPELSRGGNDIHSCKKRLCFMLFIALKLNLHGALSATVRCDRLRPLLLRAFQSACSFNSSLLSQVLRPFTCDSCLPPRV